MFLMTIDLSVSLGNNQRVSKIKNYNVALEMMKK